MDSFEQSDEVLQQPGDGPAHMSIAAELAYRLVTAVERDCARSDGTAVGDSEADGKTVVRILAFARHRSDIGTLDEIVNETRDRLSRPGRGDTDRVQATLDWIGVLYPVLRAGHPVPTNLVAPPPDLTAPDESADAVRGAALTEAARREASAALQRGDATEAQAWQRLAGDDGQPADVPRPLRRRPMVDLSSRQRNPRIAALFNASGLGAGYFYLGRWRRAAVALGATVAVAWFAATHSAAKSPALWLTVAALGISAATYDAWRLARPPHMMATTDTMPRRPLTGAVALLLLVVAGFIGYQSMARAALTDARAKHAAGDCPAALDRYATIQARYELSFTSATGDARAEMRECRGLLAAEASLTSGDYDNAVAGFDTQVRAQTPGLLTDRARAGRAEAYLRRAEELVGRADGKGGNDAVKLYRRTVDDYSVLINEHPGTVQATAASAGLNDVYSTVLADAGKRPCEILPALEFLAQVPLDAAKAGVGRAGAALPGALYACGLADLAARKFQAAIGRFAEFGRRFPDDPLAAKARQQRIAAEVAEASARSVGDLAPLERNGTAPSGTAVVEVINDSPYALEVLYSGPVADKLIVPACATCKVRSAPSLTYRYFGGSACGGDHVPSKVFRLKPGKYRVVVRASSGGGPRPYSGSWNLADGSRYDNCYYASRTFG